MFYGPLFDKNRIPPILFKTIHDIHDSALLAQPAGQSGVLSHLTNMFEAYQYVYYVSLVDAILQGQKGKIVDWGGFIGQVTILLRALNYDCDNLVLELPSKKAYFEKFEAPPLIHPDPKSLPYENNSLLAVISSGVLEHVHEYGQNDFAALQEIYRVLKPGGYFFCWNLPRKYALLELLAQFHGTSCHEKKFLENAFRRMLCQAGFEVPLIGGNSGIFTIKGPRFLLQCFNPWTQFVLDYYAGKVPGFHLLAHHITAIAKKPYG